MGVTWQILKYVLLWPDKVIETLLVGGWPGLQAQAAAPDTQLSLMPRNM